MESFTVTTTLPATPEDIFNAWLSSDGHSKMTGSQAEVQSESEGSFSAWDGYIWGRTIEKERPLHIVQTWQTSEFPEDSPDSRIEILLEKDSAGTKISLSHTDIPDDQGENYKQGWDDFDFTPMRTYFSK